MPAAFEFSTVIDVLVTSANKMMRSFEILLKHKHLLHFEQRGS